MKGKKNQRPSFYDMFYISDIDSNKKLCASGGPNFVEQNWKRFVKVMNQNIDISLRQLSADS